MKKIAFYTKKTNLLLLVLLVSLITFTACEKVDDNKNVSRDNNIPIDSKTEIIIVNNDNWIEKDGKMEACLQSTFYNSNDQYDYVRVYSKVIDASKNERNSDWEEMPNSEYTFRIDDYKIFVQKNKQNKERAYFLVAVKIRK